MFTNPVAGESDDDRAALTEGASTAPTAVPDLSGGPAADVVELNVVGQRLWLLPEKAILLPDAQTLLIADAHIGKATSFRQLGVPVPAGTTDETLSALTDLIDRHGARRVVFLGDFLHSKRSLARDTLASVARWRERHASIELTLVRGNHDDHAGDPPAALEIRAVDEPLPFDGLALAHHPKPHAGAVTLAGHLHPCIRLGGRAHDMHRLACFWFTRQGPGAALAPGGIGILPAFGAFTGMHPIRLRDNDRVFPIGAERVFPLPAGR